MSAFDNLMRQLGAMDERRTMWTGVTLFARFALGIGFLSAVADRFGLWGEPGTGQVAWGEFDLFLDYVHDLAPYLSGGFIDAAGWTATAFETILAVTVLLGLRIRLSAVLSAGMLLVFGLSMFFFTGPEAPLNASVFSVAGLAMLLALAPAGAYGFSVDRALGRERASGSAAHGTAALADGNT